MKKVVAYALPVSDAEADEAASSNGGTSAATSLKGATGRLPRDDGAMKLEVVVSDAQARRMMAAMLELAAGPDVEATLDNLLQKELELAGPEAHDLFERIVVRVEHQLISRVYAECNRVKTRAAARLGINRNTLHKKLLQYQLIEDGAD